MGFGTGGYGLVEYGGEATEAAATRDALDMAVVSVEFAFGSGALDRYPRWVQVVETENVRGIRTSRGRTLELDSFRP